MLCKNCNYILSGKENFCPNCAEPVAEKAPSKPKNQDEDHKKDRQDEPETSGKFIFPDSQENSYPLQRDVRIFYEPPEPEDAAERVKKKSYGGRIMLMLFLICAFSAGAFAVADYFNITPATLGLVASGNTDENTTAADAFSHENSIIKPDISYTPERAYVMSGEGISLRKGPGKEYAPVANLSDLTAVNIYGGCLAEKAWVYVYCAENECYGWLDGSFLAREEEQITLQVENVFSEDEALAQEE